MRSLTRYLVPVAPRPALPTLQSNGDEDEDDDDAEKLDMNDETGEIWGWDEGPLCSSGVSPDASEFSKMGDRESEDELSEDSSHA